MKYGKGARVSWLSLSYLLHKLRETASLSLARPPSPPLLGQPSMLSGKIPSMRQVIAKLVESVSAPAARRHKTPAASRPPPAARRPPPRTIHDQPGRAVSRSRREVRPASLSGAQTVRCSALLCRTVGGVAWRGLALLIRLTQNSTAHLTHFLDAVEEPCGLRVLVHRLVSLDAAQTHR